MYDRAGLVDLVERAIDAHPYCPVCDAPTDVVDEDGALVIRCGTAATATGVLARISSVLMPHLHIVLLEREELLAA